MLVEPYMPERQIGRIVIPESVKGRQSMIEDRAKVIDIGPMAWHDEIEEQPFCFGLFTRKVRHARARVGDIVLLQKYTGYLLVGKDGKTYRMVNDRDIFCSVEESNVVKFEEAYEEMQNVG